MDKIAQNIKKIESIITKLKNLDEAPVKIVAVSKKKTSQDIQSACDAGINNFGENYLQEALLKIQDLEQLEIVWHFIGSIQSNKCKEIAENFHWVHTIDRFKVASLLDKYCPENRVLKGLIQVNIDEEKSKVNISHAPIDSGPLIDNNGCMACKGGEIVAYKSVAAIQVSQLLLVVVQVPDS